MMIKLCVLGLLVALVAGCSQPIEDVVLKFDMVLFGEDMNHFSRSEGLVDVKFQINCVLKGDGETVHQEVFILATESSYPCIDATTPTLIGKSYIVGVSRANAVNFTWSKESLKENVAFPLNTKNMNKLRQYCVLQNPKPPLEAPSTGGLNRCPLIRQDEKLKCKANGSHSVSGRILVVTVPIFISRLLLFG